METTLRLLMYFFSRIIFITLRSNHSVYKHDITNWRNASVVYIKATLLRYRYYYNVPRENADASTYIIIIILFYRKWTLVCFVRRRPLSPKPEWIRNRISLYVHVYILLDIYMRWHSLTTCSYTIPHIP